MCKTDKNSNMHYNPKSCATFFYSILILTLVFGGIQIFNCISAKERQEKILEVLLVSERTSNSHDRDVINYLDSSVVDSNFLNKRDSLQSNKKDTIVFPKKENKDPELNTSPNITSTIENIEKLLNLEFAKIQEERNSLTLWIGIITVVFLIFSFYSMLKSDDLVKQSKDGLDKIQECNKKVEEIKTTWEKKISEVNEELKEKYKSLDVKFEELKTENEKTIVNYINDRFINYKAEDSNPSVDSSEENIDDIENDKEDYTPNTDNLNSENSSDSLNKDKTKDDDEQ